VRRRSSRRARRLTLRRDPAAGVVEVVVPESASERSVVRFLRQHEGWIATRLAELPPRVPFADGVTIPVLGEPLRLAHRPEARPGPARVGDTVVIGGDAAKVAARTRAWLRDAARAALCGRAAAHAAGIGRRVSAIRIADPRTRWGSCSPSGALSFSWRLVLAPEAVLDYVAAHEVAHLVVARHDSRFWSLVRRIDPDYRDARAWLTKNGLALHRYG
jgi:predicted metal-dependent hydrolase